MTPNRGRADCTTVTPTPWIGYSSEKVEHQHRGNCRHRAAQPDWPMEAHIVPDLARNGLTVVMPAEHASER